MNQPRTQPPFKKKQIKEELKQQFNRGTNLQTDNDIDTQESKSYKQQPHA